MSKIGKMPVNIPDQVKVELDGRTAKVIGPKGSIERIIPKFITLEVKDNQVIVSAQKKNKAVESVWGSTRAHISNMVRGVSEGWSKKLELVGTGYRAEEKEGKLSLSVGYSHPKVVEAPEGISFRVEKADITVEGIDKELVGQIAANIRAVRPPEPYKGKGIRYKDEVVRRKPGKAAKAQGAAA